MSDALISPAVFAVTATAAVTLVAVAVRKVRPLNGVRCHPLPLMGVLGAFVFAAQMINFPIPGTGSSGHIAGGILLASMLGPWAAFLVLSSVVVLQCLMFADGGFMALGANIINMAALSTLVAWPLVYRPMMRRHASVGRIFAASVAASVAALLSGALAVVAETWMSGITALPVGRFILYMLPIHLLIGIVEGTATGALLVVVQRSRPDLLVGGATPWRPGSWRRVLSLFAVAAFMLGVVYRYVASQDPDGLEWSILKTAGSEPQAAEDAVHRGCEAIVRTTALMPDYEASMAGVVGCGVLLLAATVGARLIRRNR